MVESKQVYVCHLREQTPPRSDVTELVGAMGLMVRQFESLADFTAQRPGNQASCLVHDLDAADLADALVDRAKLPSRWARLPVVYRVQRATVEATRLAREQGAFNVVQYDCGEQLLWSNILAALVLSSEVRASVARRRLFQRWRERVLRRANFAGG